MAGIEILIETWQIEERVETMLRTIRELPAPQEFIAWQAEDMNRTRPSAQADGPTSMFTMIYPRARRRAVWRRPSVTGQQRKRPVRRGRVIRIAGRNVGVKRPILRPELFEKLRERMRTMLDRVAW